MKLIGHVITSLLLKVLQNLLKWFSALLWLRYSTTLVFCR